MIHAQTVYANSVNNEVILSLLLPLLPKGLNYSKIHLMRKRLRVNVNNWMYSLMTKCWNNDLQINYITINSKSRMLYKMISIDNYTHHDPGLAIQ